MGRLRFARGKAAVIPVALLLAVGACATSNNSTYSRSDVGRVIETGRGTVVSSRPVEIRDTSSGAIGAATGGATGGVIGSTIGNGSGNTLATVAGVLIGAGIGYLAEREIRSGKGVEYTVEMDDGRTVAIVQNQKTGEQSIPDGTPVMVQYGSDYTRLVPADAGGVTGSVGSADDTWRNPDLAPTGDPNAGAPTDEVVQTRSQTSQQ